MVPFGPKLVFKTSWSPFAALIFNWRAAAALATSAFGFINFTADILYLWFSKNFPKALIWQCNVYSSNMTTCVQPVSSRKIHEGIYGRVGKLKASITQDKKYLRTSFEKNFLWKLKTYVLCPFYGHTSLIKLSRIFKVWLNFPKSSKFVAF